MREGASIVGIVEDAGVTSGAVGLVAGGVQSDLPGIGSRRSRNDVISHIERSRKYQANRVCESMGAILQTLRKVILR